MNDFKLNYGVGLISSKARLFMSNIKKIFLLYSAVLLIQAFLPINGPDSSLNKTFILNYRLDYIIHTLIFVVWMIMYKLAYFSNSKSSRQQMIIYFGSAVIIAVLSETIQMFVPYRSFNIMDMKANCYGVSIGFIVISLYEFIIK